MSRPLRVLAMLLLLAALLAPRAIPAGAQATPEATPAAVAATSDDDDTPVLERIAAWQVIGTVLLGAVIATIVVYVNVRFRGQDAA